MNESDISKLRTRDDSFGVWVNRNKQFIDDAWQCGPYGLMAIVWNEAWRQSAFNAALDNLVAIDCGLVQNDQNQLDKAFL